MMSRKLLAVLVLVLIISCKTGKDKEYSAPELYLDYKIVATEGNDKLAVILQFKEDDENGDALPLQLPATVKLDGEALEADSSKLSGTMYEAYRPIDSFAGTHTIVFTDAEKKEYKEEFTFQPFILITTLPDTLSRQGIELELAGLAEKDMVRLMLTDTVYTSEGVNQLDSVIDSRLTITPVQLKGLKKGPVELELIREYEQPLKNAAKAGGSFVIIYSIRREFILKD
jgi:hypothetical protein